MDRLEKEWFTLVWIIRFISVPSLTKSLDEARAET
jgi:hypothetical protein